MNVFSEDLFLDAFNQAYFPDRQVLPDLLELEGKFWKVPTIDSQKARKKLIFFDFFEPFDTKLDIDQLNPQTLNSKKLNTRKLSYLPRVSQKMVSCSEWFEKNLDQYFQAAPTTIWNNFDCWDAFTHYVRQRRSNLFSDSRRKQKKLEKKWGSLTFRFDDRRPNILETCFQWKSEQLRHQGLPDQFTDPDHLVFFRELANRQLLLISSLSASNQPVAIHIGLLHKERFYWWVPAYSSTYSQYSPGRLLLHFLLEESFKLKHKEFDFLWGDENYKWYYATHVRLIEDIGQRPFSKQLEHSLKNFLKPFPKTKSRLKHLQNKLIRFT